MEWNNGICNHSITSCQYTQPSTHKTCELLDLSSYLISEREAIRKHETLGNLYTVKLLKMCYHSTHAS